MWNSGRCCLVSAGLSGLNRCVRMCRLSLTRRGCFCRRVHSSILRDMAILGYLGQLQSPDSGAVLPLHGLVPYQVNGRFWKVQVFAGNRLVVTDSSACIENGFLEEGKALCSAKSRG